MQAVTIIGGGNYSIPVQVTVIDTMPTDGGNTTDTANQSSSVNTSLFGLSVLPSLLIVLVAVSVFSVLYYRRYYIHRE